MNELKTPYVSIIVPVYNVEAYLCTCLDSIADWIFTDWEAILIDDGSKDKSGAICDEYAARDPRFKVIHQTNAGVSAARNAGLDRAKGVWLMFIDADDWIDGRLLADVLLHADLSDVQSVLFGLRVECGEHSYNVLPRAGGYVINNIDKLPYYGDLGFCNLLYRLSIIKQLNIQFSTNMKMGEDLEFMMRYHIAVKRVATISAPVYHYLHREGSATMNPQLARRVAFDHLLFLRNSLAWVYNNKVILPQWFKQCLQTTVKAGIQSLYKTGMSRKDCYMFSRHFSRIDSEWKLMGYNYFRSPYFWLAKVNAYFCVMLLDIRYGRK